MFATLYAKLIALAVAVSIAAAGGAYAGYRFEYGALQAQIAADDKAALQATQKLAKSDQLQDAANVKAAQAWQAKFDKDNLKPTVLKERIPTYVTVKADAVACIPVGLARVMRAAADHEADPGTLQLATGQSDDDCSDVTASEMASWFTDFAGKAQSNTDQLTALQGWVVNNHAAQVQAATAK
ncbi:MAG: hypothetical protein RB191_12515 [Terriglobia bacterium]|nr:hypothetical protein [Terriglobia bacterium]